MFFLFVAGIIFAILLALSIVLGLKLKPIWARIVSLFLVKDNEADKESAEIYKEAIKKMKK